MFEVRVYPALLCGCPVCPDRPGRGPGLRVDVVLQPEAQAQAAPTVPRIPPTLSAMRKIGSRKLRLAW